MPLSTGDPIPHFNAKTPSQSFGLSYMAGRYIVLAFLPASAPASELEGVMTGLARHEALFDDENCCFFGVLRHPALIDSAKDSPPGIRWFLDHEGAVFRDLEMFGSDGEEISGWVIIDPMLRVLKVAPLSESSETLLWIAALPPPDLHAEIPLTAPILVVPRVFEPELCADLVAIHLAEGGERGTLASRAGGTFNSSVLKEDYRRAMTVNIRDPDLRCRIQSRLIRRLCPEVIKAFNFTPHALDQWLVISYDAAARGRFLPHRDNLAPETRYRQFALSISLSSSEGGNLRFPEFGSASYRPSIGAALVFSGSLLHEVTTVTRGCRYVFHGFLSNAEGVGLTSKPLTSLLPRAVSGEMRAGRPGTSAADLESATAPAAPRR